MDQTKTLLKPKQTLLELRHNTSTNIRLQNFNKIANSFNLALIQFATQLVAHNISTQNLRTTGPRTIQFQTLASIETLLEALTILKLLNKLLVIDGLPWVLTSTKLNSTTKLKM